MANKLTKSNVSAVIRKHLQTFNDEKVEITNDTKLSSVLADDDGLRPSIASSQLFKGIIYWTINKNGGTQVRFPADWLGLTVTELADFIISKQTA